MAARSTSAPTAAGSRNSGITRASAPDWCNTSSMRDGLTVMRPRDSSFHTRSATSASASPASTMRRHNASVSGAMLKSAKRAAKRPAAGCARVFLEGLAHVAEHARAQVGLAAQRVDQLAIGLARNGVDGEIAAAQIVFQRHVDTGMEGEALVAVAGLALGAGERVFLFGARMQEHRKIAAHGHEAPARHILGVAPTTTQS